MKVGYKSESLFGLQQVRLDNEFLHSLTMVSNEKVQLRDETVARLPEFSWVEFCLCGIPQANKQRCSREMSGVVMKLTRAVSRSSRWRWTVTVFSARVTRNLL